MSYNVEKIFFNVAHMSKVHAKPAYEEMTREFKEDRYSEMSDLVHSQDVAKEAENFCEDVFEGFKKFGKVRGADQMNLNYFMIYFVFPTILSEEENGEDICNILRDTWNKRFGCNINFTDYNTLYESFRTKIFGIPIGKN